MRRRASSTSERPHKPDKQKDDHEKPLDRARRSAVIDWQLMNLAGPALAAGALVPLDEMLQAALVGQLSGTASLAAMGVCSSVFLLVFKVFNFLETATVPCVAQASTPACVSRLAANALFTAAAIGLAITVTMQLGATQLLEWLATQPTLVPLCLPYMRIRALAAPFELSIMAARGALRGCQDLSTPATANLVNMVVSCGVGLVLMAKFDSGLLGLAIGRLVASALSLAMMLAQLARHDRLQWRCQKG